MTQLSDKDKESLLNVLGEGPSKRKAANDAALKMVINHHMKGLNRKARRASLSRARKIMEGKEV